MTHMKQKQKRIRQDWGKRASINGASRDVAERKREEKRRKAAEDAANKAFLQTERGRFFQDVLNAHVMRKLGETT